MVVVQHLAIGCQPAVNGCQHLAIGCQPAVNGCQHLAIGSRPAWPCFTTPLFGFQPALTGLQYLGSVFIYCDVQTYKYMCLGAPKKTDGKRRK